MRGGAGYNALDIQRFAVRDSARPALAGSSSLCTVYFGNNPASYLRRSA
jgi:hypothetical protein